MLSLANIHCVKEIEKQISTEIFKQKNLQNKLI